MDDFEQAVETGTLIEFLKQDQDYDLSAPSNTSGTVAEAELERLMREMSEGDLDVLAGEIGVDPKDTRVGLLNAPTITPQTDSVEEAVATTTAIAPTLSSKPEIPSTTAPLMPVSSPPAVSSAPPSTSNFGDGSVTSPIGSPRFATAGTPRTARKASTSTIDIPRASFDRGSRVSLEEKADLAREMMEAGTVDGLMKAMEKAEKLD